jgi:hypothetical protein
MAMNRQTSIKFFCFGGAGTVDLEFSASFTFKCEIYFYNITRIKEIKDSKGFVINRQTHRNTIFNPDNLSDVPETDSNLNVTVQIVVNKGEVPLTIMDKNRPIVESTPKTPKPGKTPKPVKSVPSPVTVFDLTSDERFKFTISLNGKTTTFRDVFTKLDKNSARVLKALGRRLEIKGYNNMKKEELVKVCTPIISFKKTDKTKDEKIVRIRKAREKNRIPRNSKKGRRLAKRPMCTHSGETVPCPKSMLLASAKRKKAYKLRKAKGIKSKRYPRKSRKAVKRSKMGIVRSRKLAKRSRKVAKRSRKLAKRSRKLAKRSRKVAKKRMCTHSGETVPCPKSMLIASAKRKKAYKLRKAKGIKSKRYPRKSRKAVKRSR